MGRLQAALRVASDVTGWIALAFLAFMMFAITLDVTVRALWGRAVPGLFEMSEMAMVMVVVMGLGWTLLDDAHIRVTTLVDRLPPRSRRVVGAFGWGTAALTFLMLAWPTTREAAYSISIWEYRWGYVQVPVWWAKAAAAAGLWLATLQAGVHALAILTGTLAPAPAPREPAPARQ